MNRIDIVYGGRPYTLGNHSIDALQQEISGAITSGTPTWLRVNSGSGRYQDAYLLIAPGIPIAFVNVQSNGADVPLTPEQVFIADSTQ